MSKTGFSVITTIMLALAGGAAPATAAAGSMSAFAGHWRVTGVSVSNNGVQALSNNDPSLMGKRLTFTSARLVWDQPPSTGDACVDPSFERLAIMPPSALRPQLRKLGMRKPIAYAVHCRSGSWGPDSHPILYVDAAGTIALPWYDGGVLKLVRH